MQFVQHTRTRKEEEKQKKLHKTQDRASFKLARVSLLKKEVSNEEIEKAFFMLLHLALDVVAAYLRWT